MKLKPPLLLHYCIVVISLLLCTGNLNGAIQHTENFLTDTLAVDTVESAYGEKYIRLVWDNMESTYETGLPELPVRYLRFVVPQYTKNFSVDIIRTSVARTFTVPYPVEATAPDCPVGSYEYSELKADTGYDRTLYPNTGVGCVCQNNMLEGCVHVVTVALYPVVYDAGTDSLIVYDSIEFSLSYDDCLPEEMDIPYLPDASPSGMINLSTLTVNYGDAPEPLEIATYAASAKQPHYYIITDSPLVSAFSELAEWKRNKGYTVNVVSIQSILSQAKYTVGSSTELVDKAAALRAYLYDEYCKFKNDGPFFCLLAGDSDTEVPIRYTRQNSDLQVPDNIDKAYIPTDNYFSDLLTPWSLQLCSDGLYSMYYSDTEYNPTIYVGRLLCHTAQEVKNYTHKLLIYEANPGYGDNGYLNNALYFVQYFEIKPLTLKRYVEECVQSLGLTSETLFDNLIDDNNSSFGPSGETVINKINKVGYSGWFGHGNPGSVQVSGFGDESDEGRCLAITALDSYGVKDVYIHDKPSNGIDNLTNFTKPSIVNSISCTVAPFDKIPGYERVSYNMAQAFTVAGKFGGPAFIGNTREGYFFSSSTLQKEFGIQIHHNSKIGIAESLAKLAPAVNDRWVITTNNLIGDPEFEMWLAKPKEWKVNISDSRNNLRIEGTDLKDGILTVRTLHNDCLFSSISDEKETEVSLACFTKEESCMRLMSLWKSGYLPVIRLATCGDRIQGWTKDFVVRDAFLGGNLNGQKSTDEISFTESTVSIKAIDEVTLYDTFRIGKNGNIRVECNNSVKTAASVEEEGSLRISAGSISLEKGFTVAKGSFLSVTGITE